MTVPQQLVCDASTPLATLMRLFYVDDDLGLRFVREVDGVKSALTLRWLPDDQIEVTIEVPAPWRRRSRIRR